MKKLLSLLLAALLLLGLCTVVSADGNLKAVNALLNYGITIRYNGETQTMADANGARVYPITYNGTTYLPVRAVSNMLSVPVEWDGANNTVWLGTKTEIASTIKAETALAPELMANLEDISALLNYGITIRYNGEVQTMYDANNSRVYPITYNGTTYLPVRAVSNMLSVPVEWDGAKNTVWLGDVPAGAVLTRGTQAKEAYENASIGIGFKLPADWTYMTESEIKRLTAATYADGASLQEMLDCDGFFCDMFAEGSDGTNINIMIEEKSESGKALATNAFFDNTFDSLAATLKSAYDYSTLSKVTYTIDGKDFYGIDIDAIYNGFNMFQKCMLIDLGDYVATVTITAFDKETANNLFENLYIVK